MYIQRNLSITHITAIILIGFIYFEIYHHYWFLELFFGAKERNIQNMIYIIGLFCISVMYRILLLKSGKIINVQDNNKGLFIPLLLYVSLGFFVVVLHEQGFDDVKRYLIYLFTPIMVFLGVGGIYRNNENIKNALHILFLLGVVFSVYSIVLRAMSDTDIQSMYGLSSIHEREYLARFTIPGIGPNVFPSMLVPMIFAGLYFAGSISGKSRYAYLGFTLLMFYNIVITASKGAVISLSAGMLYLAYKRWLIFNKGMLFVVFIFAVVLFAAGDLFFQRIAASNAVLEKALAEGLTDEVVKSETRLPALIDAITSYIIPNPILGSGFSYFIVSQEEKFHGLGNHNFYTTILAQGGLLIFTPLIFILVFLYFNSRKILGRNMFADPSSKDMGIVLNAGLIAYIVDLNFPPGFFHYYWIWFGFVAAWVRNCEMEYQAQAKVSGAGTTQV